MQFIEHSASPIPPNEPPELTSGGRSVPSILRQPATLLGTFARLIRANAAAAMAMPALVGIVLAWWESGHSDPFSALLTLLGTFTAALGMNLLFEYFDHRRSQSVEAAIGGELVFDNGYSLMAQGRIGPHHVWALGLIFLAGSALCSLFLTMLVGWPVLFFSGLAFAIAFTHSTPPIRYVRFGWGLGELGIFVSYGLLQVMAAYYVQAEAVSWAPFWASLPLGLLATLVQYTYNAVYYRRDWMIRKRTLLVVLGLERGLDFAVLLTLLSHASIVLTVSLVHLPLLTLIALGGLPPMLSAFAQARRHEYTVDDRYRLYLNTVHGVLLTGALFCLALWLDTLI